MSKTYKYLLALFPPGVSGDPWGVDLTPCKTCSLDCIFCQLGRTTNKTLDRHEYAPVWHVEAELDAWIKEGGKADYITLSGSGEPTLHTRFGTILQFIRAKTAIPTALLSNGTLFFLPDVREAARHADIVKLSLSAWDQFSFEHINRPHADLKFPDIMDGYRAFRQEFHGKLWIEVFLTWGTNTVLRDVEKIAALAETIGPDEIHLNTAVRPPAEEFAFAMPRKEMEGLTGLFRPAAKVIAEFSAEKSADIAADEETILAMLKRRPCTAQQVAEVFGMHLNEVSKYLGKLSRTGKIRSQGSGREGYFVAVEAGGADMPTYEYECGTCKHRFEKFQSMTDTSLKTCPKCGQAVRRLIGTGGGILSKGPGFYATDCGSSSSAHGAGLGASCNRDRPCCGRDAPCERSPRKR